MKFSTRDLVTIAIFGTLWGIVEITLGSLLKSLNMPMSGMILSAIGIGIAIIGRIFVPKRGATLFIGIIAMILKLFSLGGVIIGPMVGILMEALIAELVLSTRYRPSKILAVITCATGTLWVVIQPFVTGPLLFGRTIFLIWLDFLDSAGRVLGLNSDAVVVVLLIYILIHLIVGAFTGVLFWGIGQSVQARLGKQVSEMAND